MKLKIAIVHDMFYPYTVGGAEKRYWELARRLAEKHEVHIFTMQWSGMNQNQCNNGVHVHCVCKPAGGVYASDNKRTVLNPLFFACKLLPYLAKERFDVIDCNNSPFLHYFAAKAANLHRSVPVVTTFHEVWGTYWKEYFKNGILGFIGEIIERVTLRTSSAVVVLSHKNRALCIGLGASATRVAVISNGVDLESVNKAETYPNQSDVIYFGRLISHKHVDLLVDAVAKVKSRIPNVKCIIIGDGPEKSRIVNQVQRLKLKDNIKLLPFLNDHELFSCLKSSKLFVLPSTREGFGLVIPEANACGLPVITVEHKMNDAASYVKDKENGFVVALTKEAIADKIVELLTDKKQLREMSLRAAEAATYFDWEIAAYKLGALYAQLANA